MARLITALETFLKNDDWNYTNDNNVIKLKVNGKNGTYQGCFIVEEQRVRFYFLIPFNVPADKRLAVSEYICRANYGLPVGNLEMDMNDGEVRCKTSLLWSESYLPSEEMFHEMIYLNLAVLERYFPGINAVIYGGIKPAKAVEDAEV